MFFFCCWIFSFNKSNFLFCLVLSYLFSFILSNFILSCIILSYLVLSCLVLYCRALTCVVFSAAVESSWIIASLSFSESTHHNSSIPSACHVGEESDRQRGLQSALSLPLPLFVPTRSSAQPALRSSVWGQQCTAEHGAQRELPTRFETVYFVVHWDEFKFLWGCPFVHRPPRGRMSWLFLEG